MTPPTTRCAEPGCGAAVDTAISADLCPRCHWAREQDDNDRIERDARKLMAFYQEQANGARRRANRAVLELMRLDGHEVYIQTDPQPAPVGGGE
jgi:hypothetical protein